MKERGLSQQEVNRCKKQGKKTKRNNFIKKSKQVVKNIE